MSSLAPDRQAKRVADLIGKVVGPTNVRVDVIEQAIRILDAKQRIGPPWEPWPTSKAEKTSAASLAKALAKLENRFKQLDAGLTKEAALARVVLDRAVKGEQDEFGEWRTRLTHWRERLETFGGVKARASRGSLFADEGAPWPLRKKGNPQPKSDAKFALKHAAAKAAADILDAQDIRLTVSRKSGTKKASLFVAVATVLAKDESVYYQCRQVWKARNRGRN